VTAPTKNLLRVGAALIVIATLTRAVTAQQVSADRNWEATCQRFQHVNIPAEDLPTPEQERQLAKYESENLYYGVDGAPRPVEARLLAYGERARGLGIAYGMTTPVAGAAILTMIYANGRGVPRNIDLAMRFACEAGGAPAEMEGRLAHLEQLRTDSASGSDYDLCDDITSGYMQGFCADKEARFDNAQMAHNLSAVTARWSPTEQAAFRDLTSVFDAFVRIQSDKEVDQSGTGRAAFILQEESSLRHDLLASLRTFEADTLPAYTADDFRRADLVLNAVYARALEAGTPTRGSPYYSSLGTVTTDGIRQTERAWLRYREAWVRFGAIKYPVTSADSWRTWLTRRRIAMLQHLLPAS
jgi:hypothetical protein